MPPPPLEHILLNIPFPSLVTLPPWHIFQQPQNQSLKSILSLKHSNLNLKLGSSNVSSTLLLPLPRGPSTLVRHLRELPKDFILLASSFMRLHPCLSSRDLALSLPPIPRFHPLKKPSFLLGPMVPRWNADLCSSQWKGDSCCLVEHRNWLAALSGGWSGGTSYRVKSSITVS